MKFLATEFPVGESLDRGAFIAQVIAWLRGTAYSRVLADRSLTELDGPSVYIKTSEGEELRLTELTQSGRLTALAFRHDYPDSESRLWRTEAVLHNASTSQRSLRVRTQCLAGAPGAAIDTPRKPYLIKSILNDGHGGVDGLFDVVDEPAWIKDDADGVSIAREITLGNATSYLPVIYISAVGSGSWILEKRQIEKLAYDLGGIAHVVVEPNRAFSFAVRDETNGRNSYGGTVGLCLPKLGLLKRLYLGWQYGTALELTTAIRLAAHEIRSQLPARGWDWTEVQEQSLREQRTRDRNRLSVEENERLYQEEIQNLQERIRELEDQLAVRPIGTAGESFAEPTLSHRIQEAVGPEIYGGEFMDRIKLACSVALHTAEKEGLDKRSIAVLSGLARELPTSPELRALLEDISRACKDPKKIAAEVLNVLVRHGYIAKSENKHLRLEPAPGYVGLDTITVSKTPSDRRGLINTQKQIERTLGLTRLGNV